MSEALLEGRTPPHNRDAERAVIGSMIRDNSVISDILLIVNQADFFYYDYHQKIFKCICDIYSSGSPVDLVILADKLKELQQIEEIGGYTYLAELWDAAPTAANGEYYARIVRDKALVRALLMTTMDIQREAIDPVQPAEEILGQAERRIMEIAERGVTGTTKTLQEALNEAYARMDARKLGGYQDVTGLRTGYTDLDQQLAGLQNSELIILAARPSVGKTAMALNFIRHIILEEQIPCFFVSLEMARIEIAERLLVAQAQVDSHRLRKGTLSQTDMDRIVDAGGLLASAPLYIDDTPSQTMLRISANARRLHQRHNIRLICIDYLQLIEPENRRDPRQEQVAQISRRLKFLARELNIPVMALAQVNRSSEDRTDHRPRLADLRESGSIEQDADTVLMLHRPAKFEDGKEDNVIEVIISKQRNGPTGEIKLAYRKEFLRFDNFSFDTGYDIP